MEEAAKINLNINGTTTTESIKAAFKKQVMLLHEDRGGTGDIRRLIESRDFLLKNLSPVIVSSNYKDKRCTENGCTESVASPAGEKCSFHDKYSKTG